MGIIVRVLKEYGDGWNKLIIENDKKLRFGEVKAKDGLIFSVKFFNDNNGNYDIDNDDYYYYSWRHYEIHKEVMSRFMFENLKFKANQMHFKDKKIKLEKRKIDEDNDIIQIKKIRKRSPIKGISARNYLIDLIVEL